MDNAEIKAIAAHIIDMIDYMETLKTLHDCNDCGSRSTCSFCPKAGQMVRINCPLWEEGKDERS